MVIGTLLINYASKTTLPFVQVVGHIRYEVGVTTVCFTHYTVFVVAKVGGAQPESTAVFIGVTIFNQCLNGFFDFALGIERGLKEVDIKVDTKSFQIKILLVPQVGNGKVADTFKVFSVFSASEALIFRRYGITTHKAFGEIDDVLSAIAVFWPTGIVWRQAFAARLY